MRHGHEAQPPQNQGRNGNMSRLAKARALEQQIFAAFQAADADASGLLDRDEVEAFLLSTPAGAALTGASLSLC